MVNNKFINRSFSMDNEKNNNLGENSNEEIFAESLPGNLEKPAEFEKSFDGCNSAVEENSNHNDFEFGSKEAQQFEKTNDSQNYVNDFSDDVVKNMNNDDYEGYSSDFGNFKEYKDVFGNSESDQKNYEWDYEKYSKMNQVSKMQSDKSKGAKVFALALGSLLLISAVSFFGFELSGLTSDFAKQQSNFEVQPTNISDSSSQSSVLQISSSGSGMTATQVAEKVMPSVVSITTYIRYQSFYQIGMADSGGGSGFIISSDGLIVTNAHVILQLPYLKYVDAVRVTLNNGEEYDGKILACDPNTDIAILKIDKSNLPIAQLGNSDLMKVGESVFAFGKPSGLDVVSFTAGVASAVNVTSDSSSLVGVDSRYIVTDAAVNPGNSGGPLVDKNGLVMGIVSRKLAAQAIEGIGFAITINQAIPVVNDLVQYGYVKGRVKLGITILGEVDDMTAKLNNIVTGVMINSIDQTSDLASKGIEKYDILHSIDGKKIHDFKELKSYLKTCKSDQQVELVFVRYNRVNTGQEFKVTVKLMEDKGMLDK